MSSDWEKHSIERLDDAETGITAIKRQIRWTSATEVLVVLLICGSVAGISIYEEIFSSIRDFIVMFVVLGGLIVGLSVLLVRVGRIKKSKFKTYVVRAELAKKCELHSYRHKDEELAGLGTSLVIASGADASPSYTLSDYINGTYRGYSFRMMDYEVRVGESNWNMHLLAFRLGRRLEGESYLHICKVAKLFSPFVADEAYALAPVYNDVLRSQRVHVAKFKHEEKRIPVAKALGDTEAWEHSVGVWTDRKQHESEETLTYRPEEVLTETFGALLAKLFQKHGSMHIHFEDDMLLVSYVAREDLFEPHFTYGYISNARIAEKVDAEIDQSFSVFSALLDELGNVFPSEPVLPEELMAMEAREV